MIRMLLLPGFLVMASVTVAEPLYLQMANRIEPDAEQLKESRKQIKEHKEVKIKEKLFVPAFHKRVVKRMAKKKPICSICHTFPPHKKNPRSRSFLNMHTRYLACETCHFRPDNFELRYDWLSYDDSEVKRSTPVKKKSIVAQPGLRITPFYQGSPVGLLISDPGAEKIRQIWQDDGLAEKARLKARLHGVLKEKGPECNQCHNKKESMLDLKALGASDRQINKILNNPIPRFFARFKKDQERLRIKEMLR